MPNSHSGSVKEFTARNGLLARGFLSTPGELYVFDFYEEGVAVIKTEFRSRGKKEENSWQLIIRKILELTINYYEKSHLNDHQFKLLLKQNLDNLSAPEPSQT